MDDTNAGSIVAQPARIVPPIIRRVLVYGCVGVAISLFYSLAVIFFVWLLDPLGPTLASVVAGKSLPAPAASPHAKITFSDSPYDTFQPLRFAASTAASFVVSTGGMYWITKLAGGTYALGIVWNWLIIPPMNFLINLIWVFKSVSKTAGRGP